MIVIVTSAARVRCIIYVYTRIFYYRVQVFRTNSSCWKSISFRLLSIRKIISARAEKPVLYCVGFERATGRGYLDLKTAVVKNKKHANCVYYNNSKLASK